MTTYVALLRGINVAGHKRVKMSDLRARFLALGHQMVTTYLQSGNVVFASPKSGPPELAHEIEGELADVVAGNPFLTRGVDPATLHVTFLLDTPDTARVDELIPHHGEPDQFEVIGREVYLHCPNGYGRTKLSNAFFERRLRVAATTRNWNTVTRLLELVGA